MTLHEFAHLFFYTPNIPNQYGWIEAIRVVARVLMGVFGILLAVPPLVWWGAPPARLDAAAAGA